MPRNGPLNAREKLTYGMGSVPFVVKNQAFSHWLLIFYNQALGLSSESTTAVLTIATILDAFCDPIIGQISDDLQTRWGKRHPLMYSAALPLSLCFAS